MQHAPHYSWIVEAVDTNNEVFFAVGDDRTQMTSELRRTGVQYIGQHVRADLLHNFPQMAERFAQNGFIYV